jgi:copper(I)-binding protein
MRYVWVIAGLAMLCAVTLVGEVVGGHLGHRHSSIQVDNAWARKAPSMAQAESGGQGAGNGAVYVTIRNQGSEADALLSATSAAATAVELHETVEQGGKMVMRPLPKFEVPAGGTLDMKPGSYHLMLLGLKQDLKAGEIVTVGLTFEKAGQMSVEAPVK